MSSVRVLLVGPDLRDSTGAYGGGTGGYTRNMRAYLDGWTDERFDLIPCFHSVRADGTGIRGSFVVRAIRDCFVLVWCMLRHRPAIVHVLGQYRSALPREVLFAVLTRVFCCSYFYEIKAGQFDTCYEQRGLVYRGLVRFLVWLSSGIGVEGKRYIDFVKANFGRSSVYLPNICLDSEIPPHIKDRFDHDTLRVSFVGYCYDGKGVHELVEGCISAAKSGLAVSLTLAGAEAEDFAQWADGLEICENLSFTRAGKLSHAEILDLLGQTDLFCLPTRHPGEGHNNSVNEAMMMGCCVAVTRHGFLEDILTNDTGYFFRDCSSESVSDCLLEIGFDRTLATKKARQGNEFFKAHYTSSVVFSRVADAYTELSN